MIDQFAIIITAINLIVLLFHIAIHKFSNSPKTVYKTASVEGIKLINKELISKIEHLSYDNKIEAAEIKAYVFCIRRINRFRLNELTQPNLTAYLAILYPFNINEIQKLIDYLETILEEDERDIHKDAELVIVYSIRKGISLVDAIEYLYGRN